MSAIHKLSIQGIRSFDSNDRETIEFGAPLTLIVGMNGSGKTTIIECLKYATTGDLPPNSKGGVFVHDPKITGEKDIRAQVKLAFTSANGINMIVTRNIQLLAKKTTNTFKTLEGQLVAINKSGERTTLSTKSVELDTQVPLYMGVPKAILDYVIFCHQEDSLWPLSEPSNLKKKFDEIFQAMKFTKAIDNLKTIRKDMVVDIKLLTQSVEHLKIDKDRSRTTKMKIHQLEAKIDEYQSEVNLIEDQLNKVTRESDKLFKTNQDFQNILSNAENLRNLHSVTLNEIDRLSHSIDIVDIPSAELNSMLENFAEVLEKKEILINQYEDKLFSIKSKQETLNSSREALIRKEAELTSQKNTYLQLIEKLNGSVDQFRSKYNITFDKTISQTNTNNNYFALCLNTLEQHFEDLTIQLKDLKKTNNLELAKLEDELKAKQYSETAQIQNLQYSNQDLYKLRQQVLSLSKDIENTTTLEEELNQANHNLKEYNKQLTTWEKDEPVSVIASQISKKNNELLSVEREVEGLQDKILKANQQTDLFAKLAVIKKTLEEKKLMLSNLTTDLKNSLGLKGFSLILSADIDIEFKKVFINLQRDIALSNKELTVAQKEYTENSFRLSTLENDLKQNLENKATLINHLKRNLPEDCSIEDYSDILLEAELSYKTALENLKMHQTTLEFNKKALEIADRENCCYLCSRKFETDEFKSKLLSELRQKTDSKFEMTLKETVEEEKKFLNELRYLEKDIISLNNLSKKIKEFEELKLNTSESVIKSREKLSRVEKKNNNLKESRDYGEKILSRKIERYLDVSKEVTELTSECGDISKKLEGYSGENGKIETIDELQEMQKSKNDFMRKLRNDINNLQETRERKTKEHNNILSQINETKMHIKDMEKSIISTKNLQIDINNKNKEIESITLRVEKLSTEVKELTAERKDIEQLLNKKKEEFQNSIDLISDRLERVKNDYDSFKVDYTHIQKFQEHGSNQLDSCHKEIMKIEREIRENQESIEELLKMLTEQKEKLRDSKNEKRTLKDNLELLHLKDKLKEIENQIEKLDIKNAEIQRDIYKEESVRLRSLYEKLSADNAGKLGEMRQLQNQINSLSSQLTSEYKDIDERYHKEWVKLQANIFVTDDIDTYSKALDSAIMRYHSLKMEDINRIIDELWKRTYSGTDIDTIKIRSDEVKSSVRSKSYNYRVVMFKQDAELDMRGRCSAGQKVLASIIIRLALAETFGINCGVIALDEPTTNLDEENIESLARSLNNIIQFRRQQKNFQLIVITHDENFLSHMNAIQFTDHFFKVKRDDRQKSQIEWVNINRVNEY